MTNYEKIKQMSVDEMHKFFIELRAMLTLTGSIFDLPEVSGLSYNDCIKIWLNNEWKGDF